MMNSKIDFNKILLVIGILLIVFFEVVVLIDYLKYDEYNNSAPFITYVLARCLILVFGILCVWLYSENTTLKCQKYDIDTNGKASIGHGYKIAQISDFHNTNSKRLKEKIIKELKESSPDIIVITGDLIDSRRTNVTIAKEFLEKIVCVAPAYYVFGNHESRKENIQELEKVFSKIGVKILRNEKIKLLKNLELIGLDDVNFFTPTEQGKVLKDAKEKIKEKLDELVSQNGNYTILITHRPELIDICSEFHINLVLAGHAHGGQVRIPFVGGIYSPGQGVFPKYTKGQYVNDKSILIVSRRNRK